MTPDQLEALAERSFRDIEGQLPPEQLDTVQRSVHEYIAHVTGAKKRKVKVLMLTDAQLSQ